MVTSRHGAAAQEAADISVDNDEVLAALARRRATAGPAHREGSSLIYELAAGWESAVIARDPAVRCVRSGFALEDALADPGVTTIMIPRGSAITLTMARHACGRHGLAKTVFFEGGENEQG